MDVLACGWLCTPTRLGFIRALVYGDKDTVVPHAENSELVYDRYKALCSASRSFPL